MKPESSSRNSGPLIEVCVESANGARIAARAGADRVELCTNLLQGGTTPSFGEMEMARTLGPSGGLMVLIRPRPGDFVYAETELQIMIRDIETAKSVGADGVVLGCLTREGEVDRRATQRLVEAAQPLEVTFHRAFDHVRDRAAALETLIELDVNRVLTSGGAPRAIEAEDAIAALVRAAGDRLIVMAGGGVRHQHVAALVAKTSVREVHFSAGVTQPSEVAFRNEVCDLGSKATPPPGPYESVVTDFDLIRRYLSELGRL